MADIPEVAGILCEHYCTHGGRCTLKPDHGGLHDSGGICQWPDSESISRTEANFRTAAKGPIGQFCAMVDEFFRADDD